MRQLLNAIKYYSRYYRKAKTVYDAHSPFLYDFITEVLDTDREFYAFKALEYQRKMLLSNNQKINVLDLGAGSKTTNENLRKISDIAASSLGSTKKCKILFNLVNKYDINNILELGTSFGLSSLYMSSARKKANIDTIEGSPEVATIAQKMFENNKINNVKIHIGGFDNILPVLLNESTSYDMIYVDGNHTYEATKRYYELLSAYIPETGFMVFDDISWSVGMVKAWNEIIKDEKVSLSIDLFDIGIVFFNPELTKQDLSLIDYYKKPWRIGLF